MVNADRIDSIVFDLKQSVEDLGDEFKLIIKELNELSQKIETLEKNTA